MKKPYAIIGMSPGNSYFKDYEVEFLLKESVSRFGKCAVMVADVPAISTYMALGYEPNKARNKAIPKGNNLKNRTARLAAKNGYSNEDVRIVDWAEEVEGNSAYQTWYKTIIKMYEGNKLFFDAVNNTSKTVLEQSQKNIAVTDVMIQKAVHYLLSEIAFLEFAPEFFREQRVCYLYHKNWDVFEDYIAGKFDGMPRKNLDFLLLEAPYETFVQTHADQVIEGTYIHDTFTRIMESRVLRAAYIEYPPTISKDRDGNFSGIFVDVITIFCAENDLKIEWVEETGYGVVLEGLSEGRFDIFCAATWPTVERQKFGTLSFPLYYSDVGIWVREDSPLVQKDWLELDQTDYSIAVTEGDITHSICLTDFTRAKWIRIPQLKHVKGLLEAVATGKADATIAEKMTYESYKNDLSVRLVNIAKNLPVRRYSNSYLIAKDQNDFLEILNSFLQKIKKSGQLEIILKKYLPDLNGLYFYNEGVNQ